MELERAKAFIEQQARVLSRRVRAKEINASCVEGILAADADYAADSQEARRIVLEHGKRLFDIKRLSE